MENIVATAEYTDENHRVIHGWFLLNLFALILVKYATIIDFSVIVRLHVESYRFVIAAETSHRDLVDAVRADLDESQPWTSPEDRRIPNSEQMEEPDIQIDLKCVTDPNDENVSNGSDTIGGECRQIDRQLSESSQGTHEDILFSECFSGTYGGGGECCCSADTVFYVAF